MILTARWPRSAGLDVHALERLRGRFVKSALCKYDVDQSNAPLDGQFEEWINSADFHIFRLETDSKVRISRCYVLERTLEVRKREQSLPGGGVTLRFLVQSYA
jgi:hypothetical protein